MAKICLSGYYGFDNLGSDLILLSIITTLRQVIDDVEISVLSDNPAKTAADFGVTAYDCWQQREGAKAISACDILIVGGGNLLKDTSDTKFIRHYLKMIRMAQRRKKIVYVFAQQIGPVNSTKLQEEVVKTLRKCDKITVRDEESARLLQKWGFRRGRVRVTADPAFLCGDAERAWLHEDATLNDWQAAPPTSEEPLAAVDEADDTTMVALVPPLVEPTPVAVPLVGEEEAAAALPTEEESPLPTSEPAEEAPLPTPEPAEEPIVAVEIQISEEQAAADEDTLQIPDAVQPLTDKLPKVAGREEAEPTPVPAGNEETDDVAGDRATLVSEDTIRLDIDWHRPRKHNIEGTVKRNAKMKAKALAELASSELPSTNELIEDTSADKKNDVDTKAEAMASSPGEPDIVSAVNEAAAATVNCPTCGRKNPADARFCNECGNPLSLHGEQQPHPAPTKATPPSDSEATALEREPSSAQTEQILSKPKAPTAGEKPTPEEAPATAVSAGDAAPAATDGSPALEVTDSHIGKGHPRTWKGEGERLAGFCLRHRKYLPCEDLAAVADLVARAGYRIVFVPNQYPDDIEIGRQVIAMMTEPAVQLESLLNAKELLAVFDELDFLFSLRLHPLILAAVNNIPFTTIGGEREIDDFMAAMALTPCTNASAYESEELMANMTAILADNRAIYDAIENNFPALQEQAADNYALLLDVLRQRHHD